MRTAYTSGHPHLQSRRDVLLHYFGDLIYGANDGIVTTFAVLPVLQEPVYRITSCSSWELANLLADGFSMAASNYLAIRSKGLAELETTTTLSEPYPFRHGLATFIAFTGAGSTPLVTYFLFSTPDHRFAGTAIASAVTLFTIGAARSTLVRHPWWRNGLEMLLTGGAAGAVSVLRRRLGKSVRTLARDQTLRLVRCKRPGTAIRG